jgi:hypothetical protein|nr:MAG TPA: hypothetical protein [Caudoviricetes sp.]
MTTFNQFAEMVRNVSPVCLVYIDPDVYFKDGGIERRGCAVTLTWYKENCEMSITSPFSVINPPMSGRKYNIESLELDDSPEDLDYYFRDDEMSLEEEKVLQAMMREALINYDFLNNGYTIEHD